MESTFPYLLKKISRLFDPAAWADLFSTPLFTKFDFSNVTSINLLLAAVLSGIFMASEYRNHRLGLQPYAVFRTPLAQWTMIIAGILLIEGSPVGFIYARQ